MSSFYQWLWSNDVSKSCFLSHANEKKCRETLKIIFIIVNICRPSVLGSAELRSIIVITLHNTLTKSVDIDLIIIAQNYRQLHANGGSSLLINMHQATIFFIEFNLGPGLGNKGCQNVNFGYSNVSSLGFMILPALRQSLTLCRACLLVKDNCTVIKRVIGRWELTSKQTNKQFPRICSDW